MTDPAACWRPAHPEYASATPQTHGDDLSARVLDHGRLLGRLSTVGTCWTCPEDHPARGSAQRRQRRGLLGRLRVIRRAPADLRRSGLPVEDSSASCIPTAAPSTIRRRAGRAGRVRSSATGRCLPSPPIKRATSDSAGLRRSIRSPGCSVSTERWTSSPACSSSPRTSPTTCTCSPSRARSPPEDRPAWVAARWAEIAATPERATPSIHRQPEGHRGRGRVRHPAGRCAEQATGHAFAQYVRDRRTFVAQDALHMYDVWKAGVDYQPQPAAPERRRPVLHRHAAAGLPAPLSGRMATTGGRAPAWDSEWWARRRRLRSFSAVMPEAIWCVAAFTDANAVGGSRPSSPRPFTAITTGARGRRGRVRDRGCGHGRRHHHRGGRRGDRLRGDRHRDQVRDGAPHPGSQPRRRPRKPSTSRHSSRTAKPSAISGPSVRRVGLLPCCPSTPDPSSLGCGAYAARGPDGPHRGEHRATGGAGERLLAELRLVPQDHERREPQPSRAT